MKPTFRTAVCALAIAVAGSGATPLLATGAPHQQNDEHRAEDRNREQNRDRDNNQRSDESVYYNNRNYQSGWKDGQKHKHKNKKWKNDADREAYEAGYAHGNQGEQWHKPNKRNPNQDRRDH